jgi:cystathionine beta-lyase/cystathionine gamma-synthase
MTRIFEEDLQAALATRVVHAGPRPEKTSGAIMTPIYQTSTYVQPKLGEHHGFEYARTRNPTRAQPRGARGRASRFRILVRHGRH